MGRRRRTRPALRSGTRHLAVLLPALSLLALLGARGPLFAAPPPGAPAGAADTVPDGLASEIQGRVVADAGGEAVSQAEVYFRRIAGDSVLDSVYTTTDAEGAFRFDALPAGTYAIRTEHLGYEARRDTFRVPISKSMSIEIPMATEPVEMEPLRVDVRSGWLVEEGFYRRRAKGFGKFITPEDLEQRSATSLTEALRTVSGVRWGRRCVNGICRDVIVMALSSGPTGCRVKYYMDGNEMHGPVSPTDISVQSIAAIEVYRGISETPAQFHGRCGSVVMWTKRAGG